MKKILIILSILLILIIAGVGAYLFLSAKSRQAPAQQGQTTLPGSGAVVPTGSNTTPIQAVDGSSLLTRNFLKDQSVKPDPANPGYYVMGPQPAADGGTQGLPYLIEYFSETNYFAISIQTEPLGDTRKAAEQYLMSVLGLSEEQMCALKYDLVAPASVSTIYGGKNLGFSFCPGATKLP